MVTATKKFTTSSNDFEITISVSLQVVKKDLIDAAIEKDKTHESSDEATCGKCGIVDAETQIVHKDNTVSEELKTMFPNMYERAKKANAELNMYAIEVKKRKEISSKAVISDEPEINTGNRHINTKTDFFPANHLGYTFVFF